MRLLIVAVGRLKDGPEAELIAEYRRRLRWPLSIRELDPRAAKASGEVAAREAALFREVLAGRQDGRRVTLALDEKGRALTSRDFADRLTAWRDQGVAQATFLIGGAGGLDPGLLSDADLRLSLGSMTWPHALARVLLVEQIYRAQEIASGHPYHRD